MIKRSGYSLIEIIIVMVILGVLLMVSYKYMQPGENQRKAAQVVNEFFEIKNRVIEHYYDSTGYDLPVSLSNNYALATNLVPPGTVSEDGNCRLPSGHTCRIGMLRSNTAPGYLGARNGFSVAIQRVDFEMCHVIIPQLANHFRYVAHGGGVFKGPEVAYTDNNAMNLCDSLSENGGVGRILVSHY